MKKVKVLLVTFALAVCAAVGTTVAARADSSAVTDPTPYRLDFSASDVWDNLMPVYIAGSGRGEAENANEHWKKEGSAITRTGEMYTDSSRFEQNYAALYLKDCYYRYFELATRIKYDVRGLTGILFGKKDMRGRHLADGNALYMLPDPCVELKGSTLTVKKTSAKFGAKTDYYDVKLAVCADYVRCYIDDELRLEATYSPDLLQYGRIGLFTANTTGSFDGGVTIYNLDAHGNRIARENAVLTTGITAAADGFEMEAGGASKKFVYTVTPENATNKNVRFLSDAPDIATADVNGNIYALKAGTATVHAITEDGGYSAAVRVTVIETVPEIAGITIDKTEGTITEIGGKLYLSAGIYPEDAENQGYKWSSSDTRVAIVNNGTVTAMGEGECTVTVRDYYGNYVATCKVTVRTSAAKVKSGGCKSALGGFAGIGAAFAFLTVVTAIMFGRKKKNG